MASVNPLEYQIEFKRMHFSDGLVNLAFISSASAIESNFIFEFKKMGQKRIQSDRTAISLLDISIILLFKCKFEEYQFFLNLHCERLWDLVPIHTKHERYAYWVFLIMRTYTFKINCLCSPSTWKRNTS